ncbi:class I SAM-dependent methyltransferase [Phytohabitans flavus]|uniref:Uncharacterized protein n=1 Tax=Phytohabitans flavus TaxID=1076124 RepID=A0A6F8XUR8_9ACTN|nr:class I SAM-dependent methyltransferase [Phytohabitans flavus]BCB77573.1 hypothetical protein Pflav_039830 [Phytohabitans flavus]
MSTLAERLVDATTGALELFTIHLGRELDLYTELADGPLTYPELAERAGIAPRYAREWLEQQAVAGLLTASSDEAAQARRYGIPEEHRAVLLDPEDPSHVAPLADLVAGIAAVLGELPDAYRTGGGIPFSAYGSALRRGQGGINRPLFRHELPDWLAAMPDVGERLASKPIARIADLGFGEGWSTIALARAYPGAYVDGYDTDQASVAAAQRHAAEAGVGDRVTFQVADASGLAGPYDLVFVFEALHDMAHPAQVLTAVRAALAEGGTVLVADERVADTFTAPGDGVERLMYGWSVNHCLPASMSEVDSAALGTVLRRGTVHELAAKAGFAVTELAPHNDFFRFYRLDSAQ